MIRSSPGPSLDRFRLLIADRLGLSFDNARSEALAETLERRSRALSLETASYLDQLERQQGVAGELSTLGSELTIGETYFFRHTEQMHAFSEVALPSRRSIAGKRPVRILSAGCASGEEAYTLAILASEQGLSGPMAPDILGVDLNPLALKRAERAQYSEWALRDTPENTRRRYFRKEGTSYVLMRDRLPTVRFRQANLIEDEALGGGMFDILFCRNVLMYFTRQQAIRTLARLASALLPGGYLFLGHAETLHGLSTDFELCQAHGAFYYVRKADSGASPLPAEARTGRLGGANDSAIGRRESTRPAASLTTLDFTRNWLDVVDRSTQRIQALSEGRERAATQRKIPSDPTFPSSNVLSKRIMSRLIEAERWDEALDVANRLEAAESDPDHLILRAALLTHSGRFDSAEQVCLATLARDEGNAPAHYLLALLRERQGKYEVALEHDQIAADLDPTFAMPKLHLGLSWVRTKDLARARAALTQAATLLEKEDPWRVLLFGGGFQRSALIQLCERELARLDGGP